ncbi:hypothetical protein M3Y99_00670200 [Aphelenchoides fujianensis]|nr:hypothetical protein M3Y99_00670200 [Aphelenchoides fujianensis]
MRVWLQVTSPHSWGANATKNLEFFNDFRNAAAVKPPLKPFYLCVRWQAKNISVGYYTNWYDWSLIMGNAKPFEEYAPLWYWRVNGFGTRGATAHNIDDFVPFGPFKIPNIKQFVWGRLRIEDEP